MTAGVRQATIRRNTAETQIDLTVNLDGTGASEIDTGVPFFDHMLTLLARHALLDLTVKARGDTAVAAVPAVPAGAGGGRCCVTAVSAVSTITTIAASATGAATASPTAKDGSGICDSNT